MRTAEGRARLLIILGLDYNTLMRYVYRRPIVRLLVRTFDFWGYRLARRRPGSNATPKAITFIILHQIGDCILCLPTIRAISRLLPEAKINFIVGRPLKELINNEFPLSEVEVIDASWQRIIRQEVGRGAGGAVDQLTSAITNQKADCLIIFHPDLRVNQAVGRLKVRSFGFANAGGGFYLTDPLAMPESDHQVERNFTLAKAVARSYNLAEPTPEPPYLTVTASDRRIMLEKLRSANISPERLVLIHPFARFPTKAWNNKGWSEVINYLIRAGEQPLLIGAKQDRDSLFPTPAGLFDWRGKLNLIETAALASQACLFVGIDSGPGHLAAAVNCPVVSVFSSAHDPKRWAPYPHNSPVVVLSRPPKDRRKYPLETRELPPGTEGNPYTDQITVTMVLEAIKPFLQSDERSA